MNNQSVVTSTKGIGVGVVHCLIVSQRLTLHPVQQNQTFNEKPAPNNHSSSSESELSYMHAYKAQDK